MNIARIHYFWNSFSFVKNNLSIFWKRKKKKDTNSRGLKIRSTDSRGGERRNTEMPAHDRPYSPVKGLITIVKPVRRSARVGEPMRALNRRYLGTAIMCRVRLQDTRSYFLSRTHAHPPTVTNVVVLIVVVVVVVRCVCIRDASIDRQYNDSQGSNRLG